jgi:hypothetical protein
MNRILVQNLEAAISFSIMEQVNICSSSPTAKYQFSASLHAFMYTIQDFKEQRFKIWGF